MSGLTDLQLETLALIAAGRVCQRLFGYGAWRIQGATPSTVGRLVSMGLASWTPMGAGDRRDCLVTDAGLSALKPQEKKNV